MLLFREDDCRGRDFPEVERVFFFTGRPVVVKDTMARYTMDAIASCSFSINANGLGNPNCEFISKMKMLLEPKGLQIILAAIIIFNPWLQKFVHAKVFDIGVTDFVRRTFWDMVDHRRASGIVCKDFVDLLMQLQQDGEVRAEDEKDQEEIKQGSRYMNAEVSRTDGSDVKFACSFSRWTGRTRMTREPTEETFLTTAGCGYRIIWFLNRLS
ncbi:cytochrome P450 6k1-like isoform X1 [Bacillus rossius redtenbacheri]|uniref:cytochrome P450 6k1-like isoform X1 n=1 Tax=Bacillus rossius redtenbacheri TaxID=93214 RepID=UPI002FDECF04